MGKVKFGLSGFRSGVLDANDTVAEVKQLPGMVSAKLEISNEITTIMADDGPYVTVSSGITDLKLEIENYDLNSETREDWFGIEVVDGIEIYNKNLTPKDVAVCFRTAMEDGKYVWFGLLKGKFSIPGLDASTKEGSPDAKADSTTGQFVARGDADTGDMLYIGREDNPEFKLETFLDKVFPKVDTPAP